MTKKAAMTKSDWRIVADLTGRMARYGGTSCNLPTMKEAVAAGSLLYECQVVIESGDLWAIKQQQAKMKKVQP